MSKALHDYTIQTPRSSVLPGNNGSGAIDPSQCHPCRTDAVNVMRDRGLRDVGDPVSGNVEFVNLSVPRLVETAVCRREGLLSAHGAFVAYTSPRTGRSPRDKFIVGGEIASERVWWDQNSVMYPSHFATLLRDVKEYA